MDEYNMGIYLLSRKYDVGIYDAAFLVKLSAHVANLGLRYELDDWEYEHFNSIVYSLIFEIYNGFLVDSKDKICDTLNIQDLDLYIETIGEENFYEIDVNYFLSKLIFKDPKVMEIYESSPYYFNFN